MNTLWNRFKWWRTARQTAKWVEHPEGWENPCACQMCCLYGE